MFEERQGQVGGGLALLEPGGLPWTVSGGSRLDSIGRVLSIA